MIRRGLFLAITAIFAGLSLVRADDTPATQPSAATRPRILFTITGKVGLTDGDVLTVLVDVTNAPDMKDWGTKAAHYAIDVYPRIAATLPSDRFTPPRHLTLFFKPIAGNPAYTARDRTTISSMWIHQHPDDIGLVAHELTHVIQHYPAGNRDSGWLVEGIADWVRYYVIEPNSPRRHFNIDRSNFKSGYQPAAGFLDWLEKSNPGTVAKLNDVLRNGEYTPDKFAEITGGTPDDLWEKFKTSVKGQGN